MGRELPRIDPFNAWAWKNISMTFGWYFALGSVAHALLWMILTLLGIHVLSVGTYLFFVACLAIGSIVGGYARAGARLRGELVHFYAELGNELLTAGILKARVTTGQHDISLEGIRREARKALSRELVNVHYETIDKKDMLADPWAGAVKDIRRQEWLRLGPG